MHTIEPVLQSAPNAAQLKYSRSEGRIKLAAYGFFLLVAGAGLWALFGGPAIGAAATGFKLFLITVVIVICAGCYLIRDTGVLLLWRRVAEPLNADGVYYFDARFRGSSDPYIQRYIAEVTEMSRAFTWYDVDLLERYQDKRDNWERQGNIARKAEASGNRVYKERV